MPTRPQYGEGACGTGKQPTEAPVPIHRGSGHGTLEGCCEQSGETRRAGGERLPSRRVRRAGRAQPGDIDPPWGLDMKPVGEPDAGNPHVRFDERGEETERWPSRPQATAPLLDSTPTLAMAMASRWNSG
jgi:hypothetical protein